MKENR